MLMSLMLIGVIASFISITWWETVFLLILSTESHVCDDEGISWTFLIYWLTLSYGLISCFFSLMLFGINAD